MMVRSGLQVYGLKSKPLSLSIKYQKPRPGSDPRLPASYPLLISSRCTMYIIFLCLVKIFLCLVKNFLCLVKIFLTVAAVSGCLTPVAREVGSGGEGGAGGAAGLADASWHRLEHRNRSGVDVNVVNVDLVVEVKLRALEEESITDASNRLVIVEGGRGENRLDLNVDKHNVSIRSQCHLSGSTSSRIIYEAGKYVSPGM